jgi:ABC-type sugar transport system permease subunit
MDSLSIGVNNALPNGTAKKSKIVKEKRKKLFFYICMIAPFILQVGVFYFYVNISNIALAFMHYEEVGEAGVFYGLGNFKYVLDILFSPENSYMFGITFYSYLTIFFIATPMSIIFSFYVYKKFAMSEVFRVILFFPQIISTVIMTMLFKFFANDIYEELTQATGLLRDTNSITVIFITLTFYNLWMGFGANVLLASGAMSGINESIVESCRLDGCNMAQEFVHITLPSIFPTITTFIVIDIATMFSNQLHLYTFFQQGAPEGVWTIGYFLYVKTATSPGLVRPQTVMPLLTYPEISSIGVMITVIILPITLTVRKLLEKFGPSTN